MTSSHAPKASAGSVASALLRGVWGAVLISALTVSFVISFTAIIYSGPLAPFLGTGIGLALLGSVFMCGVGGFFYTFRGTICHPQDVTAIVLAVSATGIAAGWSPGDKSGLLATIVMLVAVATVVAGIVTYFFGAFRLGFLARFIPYPVVGGFLAATGYLLAVGAIGMGLGETVHLLHPPTLFADGAAIRWVPWFLLGVALAVAATRIKSELLLPGTLLVGLTAFYLILRYLGMSLADAGRAGLLLGPLPDAGFVDILSPSLVLDADWGAIAGETGVILSVALLTVVGTLLHATGLELSLDQELDLEKDLRATGIANLAGSLGGGLIGFQLMSGTSLGKKLKLPGPMSGLCAAAGCALTFFFGGALLSALPIGLFVTVVGYLGIDLLLSWLWFKRGQLSGTDYAIILVILVATATVGFFEALGVGLLAAAAMFIVSFSRVDMVRLRSTLATRRSLVERSDDDLRYLNEVGGSHVIFELAGYLFFGSANKLLEIVRAEIDGPKRPRTVVLDFSRVSGLDASVSHSLGKLAKVCARAQVGLIYSGLRPALHNALIQGAADLEKVRFAPTLNSALQEEEAHLLSERMAPGSPDARVGGEAERKIILDRLLTVLDDVKLRKGDVLLRQGAASTEMFVLLSGAMRAEVTRPTGGSVVVARFLPGATIGEIAFYTGVPRTATVVAEDDSVLLKIKAQDLGAHDAPNQVAADVHALTATNLARRLRNMTLLLRDAEA